MKVLAIKSRYYARHSLHNAFGCLRSVADRFDILFLFVFSSVFFGVFFLVFLIVHLHEQIADIVIEMVHKENFTAHPICHGRMRKLA